MDLTAQTAQLNRLEENYKGIAEFCEKHKRLTYMQFDYATMHELSLFITEPNFSFPALEEKLDRILGTLPAIKRIFAQPLTHLKQKDVILPVEAVRIFNNNTLQHIAAHSELWSDVSAREIKPVKLLSRTYEDNYGIYENLVFCKTVDDILSFVRTNIRTIQELIFANQTIVLNLLERVNHLEYFVALGKLHTGYSRNFDLYYGESARCLNKLQFVESSITPRLKRPVYKNNKSRPSHKLRKTNILSMHKEYHQVYKLAKYFAANNVVASKERDEYDLQLLQKNYFRFCQFLCIFAAGHFNFSCDENKPMDLDRLCVDFQFKQWKLCLAQLKGKIPLLAIVIEKEKRYTALIAPTIFQDIEGTLQEVKRKIKADEYVAFTPFEDGQGIFVDISSLESMRRIQQIILRGMVYCDEKFDECPFCRHTLTQSEKSVADSLLFECPSCRTQIGISRCPETGEGYRYTNISGLRQTYFGNDDDWLAKRKREAAMYFRNITRLNNDGETVCPHCGKTHEK